MSRITATLVTFLLVVSIQAHAVLEYPAPFNPNPTTQAPCGVSGISDAMQSTERAAWRPGETVTLVWKLVASDGGGNLFGEFDPLGGTDFSLPAWSTDFPTSGSNKRYNRTFIVPADLTCDRSPTKLCTLRVHTASNWHSCTMINITTGGAPPPPPPKVCTPVTQPLSFCPNTISGAAMPGGYTPTDIDKELAATYTSNLANPLVFATPDNKDCKPLYKSLLCGLSLPPCDPKTGVADSNRAACKSLCEKTMKACSVTEVHKSLYDCDALPNCNGESMKKGGMSSGGAAALSIFIIVLVATLAIFGYIYYKKGNLFGYTYDKDKHKIVKVQSNPHNYTAYVDADL